MQREEGLERLRIDAATVVATAAPLDQHRDLKAIQPEPSKVGPRRFTDFCVDLPFEHKSERQCDLIVGAIDPQFRPRLQAFDDEQKLVNADPPRPAKQRVALHLFVAVS